MHQTEEGAQHGAGFRFCDFRVDGERVRGAEASVAM